MIAKVDVFGSLDWLSFSLPVTRLADLQKIVHSLPSGLAPSKPVNVYGFFTDAWEMECGGLLRWHTSVLTQGICFEVSGSNLRKLRSIMNERELLRFAFTRNSAKCSRVDVAIDVKSDKLNLYAELEKRLKRVITKVNTSVDYTKKSLKTFENLGYTRYFGSPKSDKMLRIYDKGLQLKSPTDEFWTRIELQARKGIANNLSYKMANNVGDYLHIGAACINQFVSYDYDVWQSIFRNSIEQTNDLDLALSPRLERSFLEYLSQVKARLKKEKNGEYHHDVAVFLADMVTDWTVDENRVDD
jgi:Replication initiation factor